jgi:2-keto-4-pentenoate hydratase/2-oxohepta-3-ene-1,7-dioic acid hydratase in catechol pathway
MGVNQVASPVRAARFLVEGHERLGRVEDHTIVEAGPSPAGGFVPTPAAWQELEAAEGPRRRLDEVALLPPLEPTEVICVGLNYRAHAEESGFPIPRAPILFAKLRSALAAPGQPIVRPSAMTTVDWEGELAVVVGRPLARGTEDVLEGLTGYTGCNDISDRDSQSADGQWMRAKSFDTSLPLGPTIVRAAPEMWSDIRVTCRLNAEVMQDDTTANLIFDVETLVRYITRTISLAPGTIICTGTPAGIGHSKSPPRYLVPGDVIEVEVGDAGPLTNPIAS